MLNLLKSMGLKVWSGTGLLAVIIISLLTGAIQFTGAAQTVVQTIGNDVLKAGALWLFSTSPWVVGACLITSVIGLWYLVLKSLKTEHAFLAQSARADAIFSQMEAFQKIAPLRVYQGTFNGIRERCVHLVRVADVWSSKTPNPTIPHSSSHDQQEFEGLRDQVGSQLQNFDQAWAAITRQQSNLAATVMANYNPDNPAVDEPIDLREQKLLRYRDLRFRLRVLDWHAEQSLAKLNREVHQLEAQLGFPHIRLEWQ